MSGYQDAREESLKALDEVIALPDNKTVRPGSAAERLCKRLISVVMCTFAVEPEQAIVMRALCDFPEREEVKPAQLAKKMQVDQKTVSTFLKKLKAGGYILETSFTEQFSKRGRASKLKSARYHMDYSYFISMVRLRLHLIISRLSKKQEENDQMSAIGSFVCVNEACKELNNSFNTLDLMSNTNNVRYVNIDGSVSEKSSAGAKMVFVCDMCGELLMDESERFADESGNNLDIKRAFNQQSLPLTKLLNEVEISVKQERNAMMAAMKTAQADKEAIEQGFGDVGYKAATLTFNKKKGKNNENESMATLEHLSRLGSRRRKIDTSKFETKPEDIDNEDNENGEEKEGMNGSEEESESSDEMEDIDILQQKFQNAQKRELNKRIFDANSVETKKILQRNFEKMKRDSEKHCKRLEKEDVNGSQTGKNDNSKNNDNSSSTTAVSDFFEEVKSLDTSVIFVKIQNKDVSLKEILENSEKYEEEMTEEEYIAYDKMIVDLGLTCIE